MKNRELMEDREVNVSRHILPVAATMVGVCITVITLLQVVQKDRVSSMADVLVAIDSLLFLVSTVFSYYSIRSTNATLKAEKYADRFFIVGMVLMVVICFLVSLELFIKGL